MRKISGPGGNQGGFLRSGSSGSRPSVLRPLFLLLIWQWASFQTMTHHDAADGVLIDRSRDYDTKFLCKNVWILFLTFHTGTIWSYFHYLRIESMRESFDDL